jgi:pimeloyl-ACP methyl ester carboxylesterase
MKYARLVVGWSLTVLLAWIAICGVIGIFAAETILHPGRRVIGAPIEARARALAEKDQAQLAEIAITAKDGAMLRGWSIRPFHGNGDAVILLHGHTGDRAGMLGYADLLLRHGYSVLLPDARAHGASGGEIATYGVMEADDVRRWFDWAQHAWSPRCTDGLGESMGAAQILQSLAVVPEFCAVVAESPFASFREASYDRLGEKFGAGAGLGRTLMRPAVEFGFLYARLRYGVDLEEASPEDAVAASRVPVLLIHGKKDTNLPPRHSEIILERSRSRMPVVVLWEPAEAGHTGAAGAEPREFERRVIGWFESHAVDH